jgi:GntR family transcriptional regulator
MILKRDSTIPLYLQLADHLRSQIEARTYPPGSRLPSERELAEQFDVSRMTARQALLQLAQDGFIASHVGKGTYVCQPRIAQELNFLSSFTEDIHRLGMTPSSRLIRAALERSDKEIAGHLQITAGSELVILSRIRLADAKPIAWEVCHLAHRVCPGILDEHDFSRESLYQVLRDEYDHQLTWAEQWISARMPTEDERENLQIGHQTPVLSLTRVTYTERNRPVEYVSSVYRGDLYQLRTRLRCTTT